MSEQEAGPMTDDTPSEEDLTRLASQAGGTGEEIIRCEAVEKWFGNFQALKGIDLAVGRQEVVVVIGPSGSGKSTLIRCINRLEEHDRGRIVVDDTELTNDVRHIAEVRREVGMVFQSFNLFPHLTVLDNITLGPRKVRRWPKAKATEVESRKSQGRATRSGKELDKRADKVTAEAQAA